MINETVMQITILSRNPQSFNDLVAFEWNVTEIRNTSFSLKLYFKNFNQLTPRDLMKVVFIKPEIFYLNRTMSVKINGSESLEDSEINEIDRQGI